MGKSSKGSKLKELRKAKGLSLTQLTVLTGIPSATIWRWEAGKAKPVLGNAVKVAEALGAQIHDIWPPEELAAEVSV